MFNSFGPLEIILILVVVLLLFGAKRLPEIGSSMGKGIREFKRSITEVDQAIKEPPREDRLRPSDSVARTEEQESRPDPKRLLR